MMNPMISGVPKRYQGAVLLKSGSINTGGDTSITGIPTGFVDLVLKVRGVQAAVDFAAYAGINGDATAGNYTWLQNIAVSSGSVAIYAPLAASDAFPISSRDAKVDSASTNPLDFDLVVLAAYSAVRKNAHIEHCFYLNAAGDRYMQQNSLRYHSTAVVTSLQIKLRDATGSVLGGSTVNATSGTYKLFGTTA